MPDKALQKHRTNRVFKSLNKPLTYLGVERTLFYFVCIGAVGAFNLFDSILAGIAVFIGGFAFGHWVTNSDPAFLRILAKSERYKLCYDAAKQQLPDEIVRQQDPALKSVIELLATGQVSAALDTLQQQDRVKEIPNGEERVRTVAKTYVESPENTLIVSRQCLPP